MSPSIAAQIRSGKTVRNKTYVHVSNLQVLDRENQTLYGRAVEVARLEPVRDFNVVRIDAPECSVALLDYPGFLDEAFPVLARSWRVEPGAGRCSYRSYENSLNPPILHRKELLLPSTHPDLPKYQSLTEEAERIGLFDDPVRIGFKVQWEKLLAERGFRVVDHQLVPIGNDDSTPELDQVGTIDLKIARHRTALTRAGFSAPIQMLDYYGFLDGSKTVFDYGCGKGDDVRGLFQNNIAAHGWDPHYAPENDIRVADLVNLGFVINVIEDPVERREALVRAYSLANELLVVSVMLAAQAPENTKPFADGVITSRNTFQKYFTQAELRDYLQATLNEEPIPVAPGVLFVFKDKDAEQRFNAGRLRSQIRIRTLARPERPEGTHLPARVRTPRVDIYEQNRELFDRLWALALELGREPNEDEVADMEAIEATTGSLRRALKLVFSRNDPSVLQQARQQRTADLLVYSSLQQFEKRKPYKHLEARLQSDIKAFFGSYSSAQNEARKLLFQTADPAALDDACRAASEAGVGWYEPSKTLQLHGSLIGRLPPILRVYVGCAGVLYGDVNKADLVKIHIRSGKVSLMMYDDFLGKALPRMTQRVKINLHSQDMDVFDYGNEYACPLLYLKSRYINEEVSGYSEQLAFDEKLQSLSVVDLSGYGPSEGDFHRALEVVRWEVEGFALRRSKIIPDLDAPCGRYFRYRDLIQCGETRQRTGIPNLPQEPDSYTALYDLATNVLDLVIDYFGGIELTYGFCSAELARKITGRIAPELDQHAAYERKRNGTPVCPRLGAAVDFLVRDEDMREVANWIIENLAFDRLYYYGIDRPLHVSFGPESKREAVEMVQQQGGRRVPRAWSSR